MRLRLFLSGTLLMAFLMLVLSGVLAPAQAGKQDRATDIKTHYFKGPVSPTVAAQPGNPGISASAYQQMMALLNEKSMRSDAQKKISSQLLYASRMMLGHAVAEGVPTLQTSVEVDDSNRLFVDIAARVSDDLLAQLRSLGSQVIRSEAAYRHIRAFVPPQVLETIASNPDVIFIAPRKDAMTLGPQPVQFGPMRGLVPGFPGKFAERSARVKAKISAMLKQLGPKPNVGTMLSEGDATHRAADGRSAFGVNGAGVKIGVLSDGVSSLAASQALGDLGPVTVLPGQTGSGDEGTAMLEIIHDLAPGADLYFATAFNSIESFAQNIRDLRAAGCDIIVDDVFYYVESPFQDGQAPSVVSTYNGGVVSQAVNDVTADGAMYFSSAGNEGNLDDGTAGTYEGDFVSAGSNPLLPGGTVATFGTTPYDIISWDSGSPILLHWSDPLGGSANDYDLFLLDPAGSSVVDGSTDYQTGTQDPLEGIRPQFYVDGYRIVVFKVTGAANRFFHVRTNRGELAVATSGVIIGHSAASGAYSVAATPAADPFYNGFPQGPYPNPFNASNVIEGFSSDGPRHFFFYADGTPMTPGDFSSTGGHVIQKPQFTAADGVSVTGVGGFPSPFYGTSAAAPHAAAIAGLVKSAKAGLTNTDIDTAMSSTAIDIMGTGTERNSGVGIVMAYEALASLDIGETANPELGTVTPTENPGNGNGGIEAGEGAKVVIELKNSAGVVDATGISATLTTTTPGVTITQPNVSTYPDLPAGTGVGTNNTPFTFTMASNASCGETIDFTLTVTYTGGPSPRVLTFQVPTGPPDATISTTLDGTAPAPVTGITTATGLQTGRIYRDGNPSACGAPKAFPGIYDPAGDRQFDSYTFTACRSGCAGVSVTNEDADSYALFSAMYSPTYNPTDTSVNYAGDAGVSGSETPYGVDVVAGTPYTVVVHELDPGYGVGTNYTVHISGCSVNCTTPNQVPVAMVHNVTVAEGPDQTADASIDAGSNDPDGGEVTISQDPPPPYSRGLTTVRLTIVDDKGATAQATANVDVVAPIVSGLSPTSGEMGTPVTISGPYFGVVTPGSVTFNGLAATPTSWGANQIVVPVPAGAATGNVVVTVGGVASNAVAFTVLDFALPASLTDETVTAGNSVNKQITVTPTTSFNSAIAFACSGLPEKSTCTFNPTSVTPGGSPANTTLTIATTASVTAGTNPGLLGVWITFGGLGLITMVGIGARKRRPKALVMLGMFVLIPLLAAITSCGSDKHTTPGTPAGTYTITVTATSGVTVHSTAFKLTVQ